MSAFIVSKAHIAYIVESAAFLSRASRDKFRYYHGDNWHEYDLSGTDDKIRLGALLTDANTKSVAHRYSHKDALDLGAFIYDSHKRPSRPYDPVTLFKAINCLDYQSCECDDWRESEARAALDSIQGDAIRHLPGYDQAQWGIEDAPEPVALRRR